MPKQLSFGSCGSDVVLLQTKLNGRPPTVLPLLATDGQFGPRTLARVREFQGNNGLVVDGIVGPLTWGKLEDTPAPFDIPPRQGVDCGTGDPANGGLASHIGQTLLSEAAMPGGFAPAGIVPASFVPGLPTANFLPSFRTLTAAQEASVRPFFGASLDFSRILISDKTGLGNLPFTIAVPSPLNPFTGPTFIVMNLGTFTPKTELLVHELTHAWQSQHSVSALAFMKASVACQAGALLLNRMQKPTPVHKAYPENFPYSAYAYRPHNPFAEYNVEQIANQVEHNIGAIVAHVKSVAMNAPDPDNEACLKVRNPGEDRRDPDILP